ncbi:MAG: RrF2 family transcriptional regulator [Bdellovibrionales bacterium]
MRNEQFSSALYVLMSLAYNRDRQLSSREMAMGLKTNPVVVRRLMSQLAEAGLIISRKGRDGGVRLALDPRQVTLADVYRAVGTPDMISDFERPKVKSCPVSCAMKKIVGQVSFRLEQDIQKSLRQTKLSDLLHKID